jgi:hypothetical protein
MRGGVESERTERAVRVRDFCLERFVQRIIIRLEVDFFLLRGRIGLPRANQASHATDGSLDTRKPYHSQRG